MSREIIYEATPGAVNKRMVYCAEINGATYRLIVRDHDPESVDELVATYYWPDELQKQPNEFREEEIIRVILNRTEKDIRVSRSGGILGADYVETDDFWVPAKYMTMYRRIIGSELHVWQHYPLDESRIPDGKLIADIVSYVEDDKIVVRIYEWKL